MNSEDEDNSMGYDSSDSVFDEDLCYDSDNSMTDIDLLKEFKKKKSYEVAYKVKTTEELREMQSNFIESVSGTCGVSSQNAATLLRSFQWDMMKLLDKYMDRPEETCKKAGLPPNSPNKANASEERRCCICLEDVAPEDRVDAGCGHWSDRDCYTRYLQYHIHKEGESQWLRCPEPKCGVIVTEELISKLVDHTTKQRYLELLDQAFVSDIISLEWCPKAGCDCAIECETSKKDLAHTVPSVECHCKTQFCFGCGDDEHQPATCDMVKKWNQKANDDSETTNWIKANTRPCPKCESTIERNGGCNHMTCKKCKHEFCWICNGDWSKHGTSWYSCTFYATESHEDEESEQQDAERKLKHYTWHFGKYNENEVEAKKQQTMHVTIDEKMREMQSRGKLSLVDVEPLKVAADVVVRCRTALKWSYVFAYYLPDTNDLDKSQNDTNKVNEYQAKMFRDNCINLLNSVSKLVETLDEPVEDDGIREQCRKAIDLTALLRSRLDVLLEDVATGLQEGRYP